MCRMRGKKPKVEEKTAFKWDLMHINGSSSGAVSSGGELGEAVKRFDFRLEGLKHANMRRFCCKINRVVWIKRDSFNKWRESGSISGIQSIFQLCEWNCRKKKSK